MYSTTRRRVLKTSGAILVSTLAGCQSISGSSTTDDSGLPDHVEVTMTSIPRIKFDPDFVHIAVGGTVVWKLESGSHDTTAYHPDTKPPLRMPRDAEPWASPVLSTVGETFEWTFEKPGVYDYVDTEAVCTRHASVGTMGRVIVGWPDPEGQPGLAPPQEDLPRLIKGKIETFNPRTRELLAEGPNGDTKQMENHD